MFNKFWFISVISYVSYHVSVPWLRRLVAGLSPRCTGFVPESVRVRFVVVKLALGTFFTEFLDFPCWYHSTMALHTHISCGGWTTGPFVVAVQRHNVTASTWTTAEHVFSDPVRNFALFHLCTHHRVPYTIMCMPNSFLTYVHVVSS
jgi:hypothetical protein